MSNKNISKEKKRKKENKTKKRMIVDIIYKNK